MDASSELNAPRYVDGSVMAKGDHVFIASEQVHAVVHELIQSPETQAEWDVLAPGVMFQAEEFGLLFMSNEILWESPLAQPSI